MNPIIHLLSDTHLEFSTTFPILPEYSQIILLAGDIGDPKTKIYEDFVRFVSERAKNVVIIAGNHEYYGNPRVIETIRSLELPENVFFLENEFIDIEGYRILGSTFWSFVPPEHQPKIQSTILDYRKIQHNSKKITCIDTNIWHLKARKWLKEQIQVSPLPVIICTHHGPQINQNKSILDFAFFSDITDINLEKVVLWAYGHSHSYHKETIDVTTFWCNPVGYQGEKTGHLPYDAIDL